GRGRAGGGGGGRGGRGGGGKRGGHADGIHRGRAERAAGGGGCPLRSRRRFDPRRPRTVQARRPTHARREMPFSSNRHLALVYWWRVIFSENRYPLFGIMR